MVDQHAFNCVTAASWRFRRWNSFCVATYADRHDACKDPGPMAVAQRGALTLGKDCDEPGVVQTVLVIA